MFSHSAHTIYDKNLNGRENEIPKKNNRHKQQVFVGYLMSRGKQMVLLSFHVAYVEQWIGFSAILNYQFCLNTFEICTQVSVVEITLWTHPQTTSNFPYDRRVKLSNEWNCERMTIQSSKQRQHPNIAKSTHKNKVKNTSNGFTEKDDVKSVCVSIVGRRRSRQKKNRTNNRQLKPNTTKKMLFSFAAECIERSKVHIGCHINF